MIFLYFFLLAPAHLRTTPPGGCRRHQPASNSNIRNGPCKLLLGADFNAATTTQSLINNYAITTGQRWCASSSLQSAGIILMKRFALDRHVLCKASTPGYPPACCQDHQGASCATLAGAGGPVTQLATSSQSQHAHSMGPFAAHPTVKPAPTKWCCIVCYLPDTNPSLCQGIAPRRLPTGSSFVVLATPNVGSIRKPVQQKAAAAAKQHSSKLVHSGKQQQASSVSRWRWTTCAWSTQEKRRQSTRRGRPTAQHSTAQHSNSLCCLWEPAKHLRLPALQVAVSRRCLPSGARSSQRPEKGCWEHAGDGVGTSAGLLAARKQPAAWTEDNHPQRLPGCSAGALNTIHSSETSSSSTPPGATCTTTTIHVRTHACTTPTHNMHAPSEAYQRSTSQNVSQQQHSHLYQLAAGASNIATQAISNACGYSSS
jgi:hypothetical protein